MTAIARRVAESHGFELVDVEVKRGRGGQLVRLFVDKQGGIGLDELQTVSDEVSAILDAEDPIDSTYTLEVSSPGLDRPLRSEADYRRFVGKLAKVSSYEPSTAGATGRDGLLLRGRQRGAEPREGRRNPGPDALRQDRPRPPGSRISAGGLRHDMANQLRQQIDQISREKNINPESSSRRSRTQSSPRRRSTTRTTKTCAAASTTRAGQIEVFAVRQIVDDVEIARDRRSASRRRASSSPRPKSARRSSSPSRPTS